MARLSLGRPAGRCRRYARRQALLIVVASCACYDSVSVSKLNAHSALVGLHSLCWDSAFFCRYLFTSFLETPKLWVGSAGGLNNCAMRA